MSSWLIIIIIIIIIIIVFNILLLKQYFNKSETAPAHRLPYCWCVYCYYDISVCTTFVTKIWSMIFWLDNLPGVYVYI